jgi:hypothetical protein
LRNTLQHKAMLVCASGPFVRNIATFSDRQQRQEQQSTVARRSARALPCPIRDYGDCNALPVKQASNALKSATAVLSKQ